MELVVFTVEKTNGLIKTRIFTEQGKTIRSFFSTKCNRFIVRIVVQLKESLVECFIC